ncbi:MAG TPA: hypothetical protein VG759_18120 [Candidatus Angelobacter sp.]|jgi:hypothetical protein|nr:hypothetical protein [Candidatus Angelobacter sp.]
MAITRLQTIAQRSIGTGVLALAFLIFLGISLEASRASDLDAKPVTFTKDVAPILQAKCQECHRPGTVAPMSLLTYEQTRPWARAIKSRVLSRQMPPWHLDKTVGIQHFQNDRSLTDDQIKTIVRWVDSGALQGDPKDLPRARQWPDDIGWQLSQQFGEPDLIIKSTPYTMPAEGQDVWWKPTVDIPITEARWVRAVEMRTGTIAGRKITHHALAQLVQDEAGLRLAEVEDVNARRNGPGLLMEWAMGKNYDIYRPNAGKLLLPGARIRWEIHYHAIGEEVQDHVELAVYLYPKGVTPKYRTRLMALFAMPNPQTLDIPPNTITETQGFHVLQEPARIENFQPHMHLRGKAMAMEAILPDGSTRMLSYVNAFNFNWMNNYIYADDSAPMLPKGTILRISAWHDNTAANPNNPDPNQWVGWGDRTIDEMAHAWVNVTYITEEDYKQWVAKQKSNQPSAP